MAVSLEVRTPFLDLEFSDLQTAFRPGLSFTADAEIYPEKALEKSSPGKSFTGRKRGSAYH